MPVDERRAIPSSAVADPAGPRTRFIPEIQGLRTLALFLVVLYHVWFDRASGGVDVFLLVSAFLMTSSVLAATRQDRRFNPVTFLVRRFGRLLPLAGAVIVLTLLASLVAFPAWRWSAILDDGWASLFYVENMLLQDRGTNYYSADLAVQSPNQHFWSLSIQGQVFVLWAIAHAMAIAAGRFTKIPVRAWVLVGFGAVFVVSLAFSIWMTEASQERAYFDTRARLWEFALGSLLAAVGEVRMRRALAHALTYTGVALVAVCGLILPVGSTFPGFVALWPLGGAGLILLAASRPTTPPSLLAHPWLVRAGAYSYALYLTHWPILVITQTLTHDSRLGIVEGTAVLLASTLLSIALVRLVENPLARFQRAGSVWRSALVVAAVIALGAGTVSGLRPYVEATSRADPGIQARQSWAVLGGDCDDAHEFGDHCSASPGGGPDAPKVTFIGSSHLQQYMASFAPTIEAEGWRAEAFLLPGCQFRTDPGAGREQSCFAIWEAARHGDLLAETDVLIILGSASTPSRDSSLEGLDEYVHDIRSAGTEVITIRDNPRFADNIFACGEQLGHDDPACSVQLDDSWHDPFAIPTATASIDLTARICPGLECRPQRDGAYVFLDDNHLTASFAASMNADVEDALRATMEEAHR